MRKLIAPPNRQTVFPSFPQMDGGWSAPEINISVVCRTPTRSYPARIWCSRKIGKAPGATGFSVFPLSRLERDKDNCDLSYVNEPHLPLPSLKLIKRFHLTSFLWKLFRAKMSNFPKWFFTVYLQIGRNCSVLTEQSVLKLILLESIK